MCDCNFSLANKRFLDDSHFSVSHTLLPPAKVIRGAESLPEKKEELAFGDLEAMCAICEQKCLLLILTVENPIIMICAAPNCFYSTKKKHNGSL